MAKPSIKPCLKCGKEMPRRSKTCPHCGIHQDAAFLGLWDKIIIFAAKPVPSQETECQS